jgi:hypothetical protein
MRLNATCDLSNRWKVRNILELPGSRRVVGENHSRLHVWIHFAEISAVLKARRSMGRDNPAQRRKLRSGSGFTNPKVAQLISQLFRFAFWRDGLLLHPPARPA